MSYNIDEFKSSEYLDIISSHPRKLELSVLYLLHIILLVMVLGLPLLYYNNTVNTFYLILVFSTILGWICLKGECILSLIEKYILFDNYRMGDKIYIDPTTNHMSYSFSKFIDGININNNDNNNNNGNNNNNKNNKNNKNKSIQEALHYLIPMIISYPYVLMLLVTRFDYIDLKYRIILMVSFVILVYISHLKIYTTI